jgi:hypothetical protein
MNNESVLSKIDGYPHFIEHIIDISEVVNIRLHGLDNYSFTITMDNDRCINIYRTTKSDSGEDVYKDMCDLKILLQEAAQQIHQGQPSHIVYSSLRERINTKI